MTLVSEHPAPARIATGPHAHCLTPMVEVEKKRRKTVGWMCEHALCGRTWKELPPIPERLTGCPGGGR